MFEKLARGNDIFVASWNFLVNERDLLCFPLFSFLSIGAISPFFFFPLRHNLVSHHGLISGIGIPGVLFLFCSVFISTFFNVALTACVLDKLAGEKPTVGYGIRMAISRLQNILLWTLVSTTVGLLIGILEGRKNGIFERIVGNIFDVAWKVASYFVIPILVMEDFSPFEALSRSAQLIRNRWGEALTGTFSLGFFGFLIILPGVLLLVVGRGSNHGPIHSIPMMALGVLLVVLASLIMGILRSVFVAILYTYSNGYDVSAAMDQYAAPECHPAKERGLRGKS